MVEIADAIVMVETKKEREMDTDEVREKAMAAREYCRHATNYMTANAGKPWRYVVIPHNAVQLSRGFATLANSFEHTVRA